MVKGAIGMQVLHLPSFITATVGVAITDESYLENDHGSL